MISTIMKIARYSGFVNTARFVESTFFFVDSLYKTSFIGGFGTKEHKFFWSATIVLGWK